MLSENIKKLRTSRGMSQEIMAQQLNVVRQTVSKWEKGLSVPDALMLERIGELFEVPVTELLGDGMDIKKLDDVAAQLALMNAQMAAKAQRTRDIWKDIKKWCLIAFYIVLLVIIIANPFQYQPRVYITPGHEAESKILLLCTLDGQVGKFYFEYDVHGHIVGRGGTGWAFEIVEEMLFTPGRAEYISDFIEDMRVAFEEQGGTIEILWDEKLPGNGPRR